MLRQSCASSMRQQPRILGATSQIFQICANVEAQTHDGLQLVCRRMAGRRGYRAGRPQACRTGPAPQHRTMQAAAVTRMMRHSSRCAAACICQAMDSHCLTLRGRWQHAACELWSAADQRSWYCDREGIAFVDKMMIGAIIDMKLFCCAGLARQVRGWVSKGECGFPAVLGPAHHLA